MKITKAKLKQIIKEELSTVMEGELDEVALRLDEPDEGSVNWCKDWLPVLAKLYENWQRASDESRRQGMGVSPTQSRVEEYNFLMIIGLGKQLVDVGCPNLPKKILTLISIHDSPSGRERFGEVAYKTAGPDISFQTPKEILRNLGVRGPEETAAIRNLK